MNFNAGNEPEADTVKTKNEKLVLEAFRALGIVQHLLNSRQSYVKNMALFFYAGNEPS